MYIPDAISTLILYTIQVVFNSPHVLSHNIPIIIPCLFLYYMSICIIIEIFPNRPTNVPKLSTNCIIQSYKPEMRGERGYQQENTQITLYNQAERAKQLNNKYLKNQV